MVSTGTDLRRATTAPPHDDIPDWISNYDELHIDIGTGDGTYALKMARQHPDLAVIGLDTCLDNLTKAARRLRPNLRFLTCDAAEAPVRLYGKACSMTINFPYGSLLQMVTGDDRDRQARIFALARPSAKVEIRVNSSAASEYGMSVHELKARLTLLVSRLAPRTAEVSVTSHDAARSFPSTWAKRLGYGRPSEIIVASAVIGT